MDLKSPTAPVRPAGWPELTSVAGSAELRPPGTARILKNWREPPQSEVSERVRSVLSKITTFQRKTSLSEWETLGQDTPVRQRRGAPKAEQHSPTRHRTRPGDKLKPIRKYVDLSDRTFYFHVLRYLGRVCDPRGTHFTKNPWSFAISPNCVSRQLWTLPIREWRLLTP